MSTITGAVASIIAQTPPVATPPVNSSQNNPQQATTSTFGDAVNVSLSAPAQAVVANQGAPASTAQASTETPSAPSAGTSPAKGSPPVAAQSSTTTNVAQLIASAKQKVIPQVGVTGASDVVDSKGNISKVQLAVEIAEQAQKAQQS